VLSTNLGSSPLPPGDPHTWSTHDDVEIHTENTDSWVVFDTEINVLLDTETEVTSCGEVSILSATGRRLREFGTGRREMSEDGGIGGGLLI
jgi:hypothetical protein